MDVTLFFKRYLLPGLVFQSVIIGGGYGTGRELVEFFLSYGPAAGLAGMILVSTVVFSAVAGVTFAFAHMAQTYDYRRFIRSLLGRGWVLYELCYLTYMLIVLAVIAAAAGQISMELFGVPFYVGVIGILAAVGFVVLGGSRSVERVLATWSLVLYGFYLVLVVLAFRQFGGDIIAAIGESEFRDGWAFAGVRYAGYNLAIIPAILFVVRHIDSRKTGLIAGFVAGPVAMVPAVLLFLAMAGQYPEILDRPVPVNHVLEVIGSRFFQLTFQLILFGTLVETGAGLIHAVNERIAGVFTERGSELPRAWRSVSAVVLLLIGTGLSTFGIVNLIARGYGIVTYGFLAVFVLPILTLGVYRVVSGRIEPATARPEAEAEEELVPR